MALVYSRTPSGLVLAEHGADEAAIARALRDYDDALRLIRGFDEERRCWVWRVYRYMGSERDAIFVCGWWSPEGEPYPLSHRLLDMVRELDRNTRASYLDEDARNAILSARRERQQRSDDEALAEDWEFKHGRPVLPRSQSLRMARDKRRARGEKV